MKNIQKGITQILSRFHLYKENKDTHEAIGLIGKMLGIQVRQALCSSLHAGAMIKDDKAKHLVYNWMVFKR